MKSLAAVLVAAACLAAGLAACEEETVEPAPGPVTPAAFGQPYEKLGEWHLFVDGPAQLPSERVEPYDVIAPLFSDYTSKWRFVHVPEGETIELTDDVWEFPVGTIFVKTFAYAADLREPDGERRLMETRLLWRQPDGWTAHTYVWDDAQQEAVLERGGRFVPVTFIDASGETVESNYRVPNENECKDCHGKDDVVTLLGPRTRQLDRDHDYGSGPENQIDHFAALGWLSAAPPPSSERERLVDPYSGEGDVSLRARSYLDANCSGCHRPGGGATQSSLLLDFRSTDPATEDPTNWGVCKVPTSAGGSTCGNTLDVVPGDPDASIMICRMSTTEPEDRMPPLGSLIVHEEGLVLLREWIESLDGSCSAN